MNEIYIALGAILTAGGTGWLTYLFTKAKFIQEVEKMKVEVQQARREVESSDIDNDIKLSGHYKTLLDDLPLQYEKKFADFEKMANFKISSLEEQLKVNERLFKAKENALREELKMQIQKNKLQEDKIKILIAENKELKTEIKTLKNGKSSA